MFRDESFKPTAKDINCVLMNGGVGDHIGSLVAVDYIARKYPWLTVRLWCPDFLVEFAKNVLNKRTVVRGYSDMPKQYDPEKPTLNTKWDGRHSPMKVHIVDYAFHVLADESPAVEHKNYLKVNFKKVDITRFRLPEAYVCLSTAYTAAVREFSPKAVNEVTSYLIDRGVTPVFIGQKDTRTGGRHDIQGKFSDEIDFSVGLDLRDRTTLLQAAAIIQGSKALVGVDNGLMHVAGCTDAPIVGGFTTVNPELRNPIRNNVLGWNCFNVVPDESLGCRFCQVRTNFLFGHDYKECLYKDFECVKQLTGEKFIAALERIL